MARPSSCCSPRTTAPTSAKLYEGANLEELTRITDELHDVEGADAIITPLTSLTFSANLLSGGVQLRRLVGVAVGRRS